MEGSGGGVLLIAGSAIFFLGAAIGVPGVFTQSDPNVKLRMLEERLFLWRLSQPLYAAGTLVAAAGVGALAASSDGTGRTWLYLSCLLLVVGALSWSWSVYLRMTRHREFALGGLPGWPFATYVFLTSGGLALLGVGLLLIDFPTWLGWLTLVGDLLFLAIYLRMGDIPPFVFYVLLTAVGVGAL